MLAGRFVQSQLDQLRTDIGEFLNVVCHAGVNHDYWGELGCLDNESKFEIRNAVTQAFELASQRWYHVTEVLHELEAIAEIIKDALEIGLDVLCPTWTFEHYHAVVGNVLIMFDRRWRGRLERVMLDYVKGAVKIQSLWRKCYYEPDHLVCRRRLMRSFETMTREIEAIRAL